MFWCICRVNWRRKTKERRRILERKSGLHAGEQIRNAEQNSGEQREDDPVKIQPENWKVNCIWFSLN